MSKIFKPALPTEHNPPTWIKIWFAVSTLIVYWDGFCLLRPWSFSHWIWAPYVLYQRIDLVYSPATFAKHDGFTSAQALLNLIENAFNITYLYQLSKSNPSAILIGFTGVLFTFWKTLLYWLMDFMGGSNGWNQTGHNSKIDWWILFAIPNGFWILVPGIIAIIFGRELSRGLKEINENKVKSS